jgi:hypothetical protein
MNKDTKYLLFFLGLIVLVIVGYRYQQYVINRNFTLLVNTVCDSQTEKCFVMDCVEGEEGCDKTPYKKVELVAKDAPQCLEEHTCTSFSCGKLENCTVSYCTEDTLEDGEVCASTTGEGGE